jgi:nitrate/TMAO reductase-like tetraheme cytochrome c subunit
MIWYSDNIYLIYRYWLITCAAFVTCNGIAQLSPGDLTAGHTHLEGILNCTKCHNLGAGIADEKCLNCHLEIQQRIQDKKGYHVSSEVQGKQCIQCHSDHHGKNFEIIRFDRDAFDHKLTGYELQGAHKKVSCDDCHNSEFTYNTSEIIDKERTFLGLDAQCLSCHKNYHKNTLPTDCLNCHDMDAFKPATLFDHDESKFPLVGKHKEVDCVQCHEVEDRDGDPFQVFKGMRFENCTACHEDVHENRFGRDCRGCHSEETFSLSRVAGSFDHSITGFALAGQHKQLDCRQCHQDGTDNRAAFQEFASLDRIDCIACHEIVHGSSFSQNCSTCHTERSFHELKEVHTFSHKETAFHLVGKHSELECTLCHENSFLEPIAFDRCDDCHTDFHEGQFETSGYFPDCAECHNEYGFSITSYSIEEHSESKFPLVGAHLATPCFGCHQTDEKWTFRNIGSNCNDCHEDIHAGTIDVVFYPDQTCQSCHTVNHWSEIIFDHSQTNFELTGIHQSTRCSACHEDGDGSTVPISFSGLSGICTHCHTDAHFGQFEVNGHTDCTNCHGFENWQAIAFDHNSADFILEGKHEEVACSDCHKEIQTSQNTYIQYKFEDFRCVVCHQ